MTPNNSAWTSELLEAYHNLPIPTLYEFALAGEKVSVELRKQREEIQKTEQAISMLSSELREVRERSYTDLEFIKQKKRFQHVLMDVYDMILLLKEQAKKSLGAFSEERRFKSGKIHKKQMERMEQQTLTLNSFEEGVCLIEEKFLTLLQDVELEPFAPVSGDSFAPKEHRAVARKKGTPPGTVQKTVRTGYKTHNEIVRYADVIINY